MSFRKAAMGTKAISSCYKAGLQALEGKYSAYVECKKPRLIEGSIFIEGCVGKLPANTNPWDYAIGFRGVVYFMEVHPANTIEVNTVIAKASWLTTWLKEEAPLVNRNCEKTILLDPEWKKCHFA